MKPTTVRKFTKVCKPESERSTTDIIIIFIIGTGRSVTNHAFLVEAGVDSHTNEQPFQIISHFFNTIFFSFSCFFL